MCEVCDHPQATEVDCLLRERASRNKEEPWVEEVTCYADPVRKYLFEVGIREEQEAKKERENEWKRRAGELLFDLAEAGFVAMTVTYEAANSVAPNLWWNEQWCIELTDVGGEILFATGDDFLEAASLVLKKLAGQEEESK